MSTTAAYVATPKLFLAQVLPADTTTKKTIATGAATGTKITGLSLSSSETATNRDVAITITRGAVIYNLCYVTVPFGAGASAVQPVTPFSNIQGLPIDNDGQRYIFLNNGDLLQMNTTTAVTAARQVDGIAIGGDF